MYNIVICDDNKEYIKYLKRVLNKIKNEREIEFCIFEYYSGEDLIQNLDYGVDYDLLILDMQLGGINGDEVARLFREKYPFTVLVFCSGILQPTPKSFKAKPFRYILKEPNHQELIETMKEIIDEVEKYFQEPFVIGHFNNTYRKVMIKNILYLEKAKRGSKIILCPEGEEKIHTEKLLLNKKPEELLDELEEYGFSLAQSSYLVNMNHIETINLEDFIFDNGEIFKISRAYKKNFKEAFVKYFFNKFK